MSNKYDKYSGVPVPLKLYADVVYLTEPDVHGKFADKYGHVVASRQVLELTQDPVYKTQFRNDLLSQAFPPLTEKTEIIYYNEDGEVPPLLCRPSLKPEYASIVCEIEPEKPLTKVSVVIYSGPTADDVLLKDGSVTMDKDYVPERDTDLVTKHYADDLVEDFTAAQHPLRDISIKQGNELMTRTYYKDNAEYPVVLFRTYSSRNPVEDVTLTVSGFAIENNFTTNTCIAVVVNGVTNNVVKVVDILNAKTSNWRCTKSENIYGSVVDRLYWKNTYELTFNLKYIEAWFSADSPFIDIHVKLWDNIETRVSSTITVGIDEYISSKTASNDISIKYLEAVLDNYKTQYVSGERYFSPDPERIYTLPVTVEAQNTYLQYFRSDITGQLNLLNEGKQIVTSYELSSSSHLPTSGIQKYTQDIEFTVAIKYIQFLAFNIKNEPILESTIPLNTDTDNSDESNRVTTPSGSEITPARDYGKPWDSSKELNDYDMKLRNSVYYENSSNVPNAVCFVVEPKDCYSHINIDIEHDGKMYILSEGNTGWLDCQVRANPVFKKPVENEDGCLVNDNYFTFGKVMYDSRVFIRIIGAKQVKIRNIVFDLS